jgi:hypothetical protein
MEPLQSIIFLLILVAICFSPWIVMELRLRKLRRQEQHRLALIAWDEFRKESLATFPDRCKACKEPITWDEHYQEWTHEHTRDPFCS